MQMIIDFPGGARVDAHFNGLTVQTDQPAPSGDGSAPTPFEVFLSSLGTCAGIYVLGFCRQRGLDSQGIRLIQTIERDPQTGMVGRIDLDIQVPPSFPEKYYESLIRVASMCAVKKHLEKPPVIEVRTSVA